MALCRIVVRLIEEGLILEFIRPLAVLTLHRWCGLVARETREQRTSSRTALRKLRVMKQQRIGLMAELAWPSSRAKEKSFIFLLTPRSNRRASTLYGNQQKANSTANSSKIRATRRLSRTSRVHCEQEKCENQRQTTTMFMQKENTHICRAVFGLFGICTYSLKLWQQRKINV